MIYRKLIDVEVENINDPTEITNVFLQEALLAFRPEADNGTAMSCAIHRLLVEINEMIVDYAMDKEKGYIREPH